MSSTAKIITTTDGFSDLENDWKALEQRTNHTNITTSFDWLFSWWSVFERVESNKLGFDKELLIICVWQDGVLDAVAPLVKLIRKVGGIKIRFVEFLGQQWGGTFCDIVGRESMSNYKDLIMKLLYDYANFDVLFLTYIPQNTIFFSEEELYLYSSCPGIRLDEFLDYNDYVSKLYSKNLKQNLRTSINRIKKDNNTIVRAIENINENNFKDIVEISKSKLLDDKASVYQDNNKKRFLELVYKRLPSNAIFIKINEKNVAYRTNVFLNGVKFCIDASYDRRFNKYELGSNSVDMNIRDSFDQRLVYHCMGPGLDAYKLSFTKQLTNIYMFTQKGNTLLSNIAYMPFKIAVISKSKKFKKSPEGLSSRNF